MRANSANSSTIVLRSVTCRSMVIVSRSNVSRSWVMLFAYFLRSRSAASCIGVSGFLISCAMRRATSAQAAVRWATTRSVTSSKVTTEPTSPPLARSRVTITANVRSSPPT